MRSYYPVRCEPNPNGVSAGRPSPETVAAQCQIEESGQHRELQRLARRPLRGLGRTDNTGGDDGRLVRAAPARRVLGCRRPVAGPDVRIASALPVQRHRRPDTEPAIARRRGVVTVCQSSPLGPEAHTSGSIASAGQVLAPTESDGHGVSACGATGSAAAVPAASNMANAATAPAAVRSHAQTLVRSVRISMTL